MQRIGYLLPIIFLTHWLTGCMTQSEKQIRGDLFRVQTRLLQLERKYSDGSQEIKSKGDQAGKQIASTSVKMEQIQNDIQRLKGSVDTLKVGIITGELPGSEEETSVAKRIAQLSERVQALEASQAEMLNMLEKGDTKAKAAAANAQKRKPLGDFAAVEEAFKAKKYKAIVDDAPGLLKSTKGANLVKLKFYYSESFFKVGRLKEAALIYDELVKNSEIKNEHPKIYLRLGDCFRHLGDSKTALVYYKELVAKYPKSDEVEKAQGFIAKIEGGNSKKSEEKDG